MQMDVYQNQRGERYLPAQELLVEGTVLIMDLIVFNAFKSAKSIFFEQIYYAQKTFSIFYKTNLLFYVLRVALSFIYFSTSIDLHKL